MSPYTSAHERLATSWMDPLCSLGHPMKRSLKGFVFRLFCGVTLFTSFAITKIPLFAGKSVAKVVYLCETCLMISAKRDQTTAET